MNASRKTLNEMRKHAGLPPLHAPTDTDIHVALEQLRALASSGDLTEALNEDVLSTMKAILTTVGQPTGKGAQAAADRAKKLPKTLRATYRETEVKAELRTLYKQFINVLNAMDKVNDSCKTILEKDPEVKKVVELFTHLLHRSTSMLQARAGASVVVKEDITAADIETALTEILEESQVEQIDGGYRINGTEYVSDEAEQLVDEAKEMAHNTGKKWEDVLITIVPKEQLDEAKYVSAKEFTDEFYSLLDSLKNAARDVGSKRGKLRNWLRKSDFRNQTQADELFDVFLDKFHLAMVALRSCDKQLQRQA